MSHCLTDSVSKFGHMKIHVRLLSGGSVELDDVNPKGTVSELKECIARQQGEENAPVNRQRLISGGRELKDQDQLSSYGLNDGAVLHLVVRPIVAAQPGALLPTSPVNDHINFTAVDLSGAPQTFGRSRSVLQASQICKVFDSATRMCMLTIVDGVVVWMTILLFSPIFVPLCFFVVTGYYGASHYSVPLLSTYAAFLMVVCTASAYVFVSEIGVFAYIGIVGMVWHLYVILQVHRLISSIGSLTDSDLALLRSVDSTPIPAVTRRTAPRIWVPTLSRAAAPTVPAAPAA